jgi:5-methylcytosine-specific restriction endonuclease McrA
MSEPVFKLSRVAGTPVSDKELVADLRRVAELLEAETVSQNQYIQHGEYHESTLRTRFGSWNNALLRSGLKISRSPISDEELISDLCRVAQKLNSETVTQVQYESHGVYNRSAIEYHFGTWNKGLFRAGLKISNRIDIPEIELFENILTLWQHYGRQPSRSELTSDLSCFSQGPYNRRFGSWMNALRAFVDYANGIGAELTENLTDKAVENLIPETTNRQIETIIVKNHKTPRNPSLRLRWRVLQRDNFKCCGCGASPAITLGVKLDVDHVFPWEKGGETFLENLQTLCSKCNSGKSNLLPEVTDLLFH